MKKHLLLKSVYGVLIATLMPIGMAQTTDRGGYYDGSSTSDMRNNAPAEWSPAKEYENRPTSAGAQGPMRSDGSERKSTPKAKVNLNQRDFNELERSPQTVPISEGGLRAD